MATVYKRHGSPYWQARIIVGGEPRRISTGERDEKQAQHAANIAEAEANRLIITASELRLRTAAEKFFQEKSNLRPATIENYKVNLGNIVRKLGDFPLKLLDENMLSQYVNVRKLETGTVAIRRDLAFLSSLYKTARSWTGGPKENPVRDFDKSGLDDAKERSRWLTEQEVERLLGACKQLVHKRIIVLLLETGMRIGELQLLKWDSVDFRYRQIVLWGDDTKNGDYRIVPMTNAVFDTLQDTVRNATGEYVLENPRTGKPYTTFKTAWVKICQRAKVADCRIHDLRHTFASWGLQRGVNELALQDLLGHKTRSMTRRYAKSSIDSLEKAVMLFSGDTLDSTVQPDK